jgi:hypothetical protein
MDPNYPNWSMSCLESHLSFPQEPFWTARPGHPDYFRIADNPEVIAFVDGSTKSCHHQGPHQAVMDPPRELSSAKE